MPFSAAPALQSNHHRVLRLLRDRGPQSRATLSVATRLSATTITKIVIPLLDRGYLSEETAELPSRVGRPATKLRLEPGAVAVIGVHIGVGEIVLGMADGAVGMQTRQSIRFEPTARPGQVLDLLAGAIETELRAWSGPPVIGVGVAVPGSVDIQHRKNDLSINLDWHDVAVADQLEARLRLPVVVDHNVRAMALADQRYGRPEESNLAYVYVKAGTGLGLVLNGEPFYSGSHGVSSLGHLLVDPTGRPCSCGLRGCVETVVSETYVRQALDADESHVGSAALLPELEGRARTGDADAQAALTELSHYLSFGLASVINLMGPRTIVMGGILAGASASLLAELTLTVDQRVFPLLVDSYAFAPPKFTDSERCSAGAAAALEYLLFDPGRIG